MPKGLVVGLPLHGHMNPLLALVRELVRLGDTVVVYSTAPFAERIREAGARYQPYRPGLLDDLTTLPDRTEQLSSLLMGIVDQVLDADLPDMRVEDPDYIITDSVAPWGNWAAQILDVPVVTSVTTFAVNRHVLAFAASHGVRPKSVRLMLSKLRHVAKALVQRRQLSRRHQVRGLGVFGTVFGQSGLNIVYTSREFQPCGETFDQSFKFVGPPQVARTEADAPNWPTETDPVVYISLGTLFNAGATFYRHCFEAFRAEPVRIIMSVGSRVSLDELGDAPANVHVAPFLPQLQILTRASACVTHGGMNTVSECLHMGVPMVTVPQMGEQELVSRRVEQLGAGVYLARRDVSPRSLLHSVQRLLVEGQFREHAARIGETLRAAGGPARAAGLVQTFVGGTAR